MDKRPAKSIQATAMAGVLARCEVCSGDRRRSPSVLCKRCRRLRDRWGTGKTARTDALKRAWSRKRGAFLCHYSGVTLNATDPKSPWYLSFDHRTPGDSGNLVVCAALVNHFKSNLTEAEFRRIVIQLGECFTGARTQVEVFQPAHWGRSAKLWTSN